MIDPDWFATVRCLTGVDIGGADAHRLSSVLGEQEEVLPYLLLNTNVFAGWPKARGAIKGAVRSAIRPTAWREVPEGKTAPAGLRESFRTELFNVLSDTAESDRLEAIRQLALLRSHAPGRANEPHVFIES